MCMYMYMHIYIYIYIYREREIYIERERLDRYSGVRKVLSEMPRSLRHSLWARPSGDPANIK